MKKRKFSAGGWSTTVSFDAADAKRRADEWAAEQAKKTAPEPKKPEASKPAAKPAVSAANNGTSDFASAFKADVKKMEAPKPSGPKPGSEAYVDRQVADSRASKAAQERGKRSLDSVSMLDKSAPSKLRREVAMAAASIPLGMGARAAIKGAAAERSAGYLGKAGTEALKGLKKRGQMLRNAKKARDYKGAQKGEWNDTYGLGLRKGGAVKAYASGGMVRGCGAASKGKKFKGSC